ncbi:hypothetical protein PG984_009096 [Apiospora sp. TS-2023a]
MWDINVHLVSMIAIHGLDTESPKTWVFEKDDGSQINWLSHEEMLPAAIPGARIYTYDWNAKAFDNAPVQTLLGHADTLLGLITAERGQDAQDRPLLFVASCFGGLVLAEHAAWLVTIKGIMGEQASDKLIQDLEQRHNFVQQRVQKHDQYLKENSAWTILKDGAGKTSRIVVAKSPACIHGFLRHGLDLKHVMMNKSKGPEDPGSILVLGAIEGLVSRAQKVLKRRRNPGFGVFSTNEDFVGRETVLEQLLDRIPPHADPNACQRRVIEGLGGIGVSRLFGLLGTGGGYDDVRERLPRDRPSSRVKGFEEDKADVKALVKAALSRDEAGPWLLIIDNADNTILFAGGQLLSYLPFSHQGSILFTTRNHQAAARLQARQGVYRLLRLSDSESGRLLHQGLQPSQVSDLHSTTKLLEYLTYLSLAINMIKMLSKDFKDPDRYEEIGNAIAVTWLVSFQQISRDAPRSAGYLKSIAYFVEKDVPVSFLSAGEDEMERDEATNTLQAYTFVMNRGTPDRFDIHRLYSEAEEINRRTLALRETVLGHEHPDTLGSMNNLALVLRQQGKYSEAEEMHRETYDPSEYYPSSALLSSTCNLYSFVASIHAGMLPSQRYGAQCPRQPRQARPSAGHATTAPAPAPASAPKTVTPATQLQPQNQQALSFPDVPKYTCVLSFSFACQSVTDMSFTSSMVACCNLEKALLPSP